MSIPVSFRIPDELYERYEGVADMTGLPKSRFFEMALQMSIDEIEENGKQNALTAVPSESSVLGVCDTMRLLSYATELRECIENSTGKLIGLSDAHDGDNDNEEVPNLFYIDDSRDPRYMDIAVDPVIDGISNTAATTYSSWLKLVDIRIKSLEPILLSVYRKGQVNVDGWLFDFDPTDLSNFA